MYNEDIQDEYGCLRNNYAAAMTVRNQLQAMGAAAFALAVGHGTMFHLTMINLGHATMTSEGSYYPTIISRAYHDGSQRGLAIAIDRFKAYAIGWDNPIGEPGYLAEKWMGQDMIGVTPADLWPFINTILTGINYYKEPQPWLERLGMTEADIGKD